MTVSLTTRLFTDGLRFGEGPRWHDGQLWLSDMHAKQVLRFDASGNSSVVVEVEGCPSGLGWLPGGDLLVVSMEDRKLLRFDGNRLQTHADLSGLAKGKCNDMVVDHEGRAYVGNFGFDLYGGEEMRPTDLIRVDTDGSVRIVASELLFPNGSVITPDGRTLVVAESFGERLTAFDIDRAGDLSNRRSWADLPQGTVPDGICLDAGGGIWVASPVTNECIRVEEGGTITHRAPTDCFAIACILGGTDLYILVARSHEPEVCRSERGARVMVAKAPFAAAGLP